jgi:sigma-E factor negative regulatory protein RseC
MEPVKHIGVIERIEEQKVFVKISQESACSECHSKSVCMASEKIDKVIEVKDVTGNFKIGQSVLLTAENGQGLTAVLFSYVLPLVLLIVTMFIFLLILAPGKDGLAALTSVASVVVYYIILFLFKNKIGRKFRFKVSVLE